MAEGARIAEAAGADVIDINMGCPAEQVTGGQSGSALMRDLDHALGADRGDRRRGSRAGHAQDAARLGRSHHQCAGARPPRRSGRRAARSPCTAERAASSMTAAPIGRGPRRQGERCHSGRGQRRHRDLRGRRDRARSLRRRRRDDRARRPRASVAAGTDRASFLPAGATASAPPLATQFAIIDQLYEEMLSHHGRASGRAPCAQAPRLGPRCGGRNGGAHPRRCSRHIARAC